MIACAAGELQRHFNVETGLTKEIGIYTLGRNMGMWVKITDGYYGRHATLVDSPGKLGGRVRVAYSLELLCKTKYRSASYLPKSSWPAHHSAHSPLRTIASIALGSR